MGHVTCDSIMFWHVQPFFLFLWGIVAAVRATVGSVPPWARHTFETFHL